ncbi:YadA C-terminal domain-containing protein [Aliivibrio sp. S3MY1]|uniref:YadA C-terminal domain-containing protein n=1 Tax=unclassified Aliivibrio TaxID=2645654 RepID=UPI00237861E2|nr:MULTISPECIES: YadA C-terminal domain-containing protein [unclassified Aliivibrio]MDD9194459.1 YadA C-terminal domain-containing protein [Aliivibrio sp. S3MY1]MDD9198202.1 YadA C-terminal domain-containing protein [Aliivibrio sp. S2MY1]
MKKSILALSVLSVLSFGASAAAPTTISDVLVKKLDGVEFTENLPDGVSKISKVVVDTTTGVITYSTFDSSGVETTGLTFDTQNPDGDNATTDAYTGDNVFAKLVANHEKGSFLPVNGELPVNGDDRNYNDLRSGNHNAAIKLKIKKNTDANGFANMDIAAKHGIEDLSVVEFTVDGDKITVDTNGSAPNGEIVLSKEQMAKSAKDAVLKESLVRNPVGEVPVTPVTPIELRDDKTFNELMGKWGKDSSIETIENPNTGESIKVLTFVSPISGEERQINLSDLNETEIETLKVAMREHGNNLDSHTKTEVRTHIRTQIENRPDVITDVRKKELINAMLVKNDAGFKLEVDSNGDLVKKFSDGTTADEVVTSDDIANAKAKVKKEVEKRTDAGTPPVENPVVDPAKAKEAVQELVSYGYSSTAVAQQQSESIADNAANIDKLFNVTDELREDLELQGARNMAAISARAFTTEEGQFSVGAGLGGSGSENAMAIGGAYQINAEWSVNSTVAFDTGSNVDYGVGVNYTW